MAIHSRTRKRVRAIRRAPDGSAFEKCGHCGESVAIALVDMHDCEKNKEPAKRFRGLCANLLRNHNGVATQAVADQPRSAFCFFMENLEDEFGGENFDDLNKTGFEIWKKLSTEERQPYITRAKKVNGAYHEILLGEVNNAPKVEDEADSAMVGKFDEFLEDYEDHYYSGSWKVSPSCFDDNSRSR